MCDYLVQIFYDTGSQVWLASKFAPDSTNFAPIFQVVFSTIFAPNFQVKRKKVVFLFTPIFHLFSGHFLSPSRT